MLLFILYLLGICILDRVYVGRICIFNRRMFIFCYEFESEMLLYKFIYLNIWFLVYSVVEKK